MQLEHTHKKFGNHYRWIPEEEEIVKLHYRSDRKSQNYIHDLILERFGMERSRNAIQDKAAQLHLVRNVCSKWTKEDEEKLKQLAGQFSTRTIAKKLGRRIGSIERKCHDKHIRLSMTLRHDWYTLSDLTHIFGVSNNMINNWIDGGKLKSIKYSESNIHKITATNVKNFILRYPTELTGRNVDIVQLVAILCPNAYKKD